MACMNSCAWPSSMACRGSVSCKTSTALVNRSWDNAWTRAATAWGVAAGHSPLGFGLLTGQYDGRHAPDGTWRAPAGRASPSIGAQAALGPPDALAARRFTTPGVTMA